MLADNFSRLKTNLELTQSFDDLVQQRHNAVRSYIENQHVNVVDTKLIGSIKRKTRIQPTPNSPFDIDVLVIMGSFYNWLPVGSPNGITADQALGELHRTMNTSDRYAAMSPQVEPPTISIQYADKTLVEFVPAYIDQIGSSPDGAPHNPVGRAYWIPKNGKWELADYDYEANYITEKNLASDGWLIPTIKMLKAIKRIYFPQMRSFHLDIIATAIIPISVASNKQYGIQSSYPKLIADFFTYAPLHLTLPAKIPGSHSPAISLNSAEALALTDTFQKIKAYIDSFAAAPQEYKQIEGWGMLFGDVFPNT